MVLTTLLYSLRLGVEALKLAVCCDLAGLLARLGSLVVRPMVLGESALMPMAWTVG